MGGSVWGAVRGCSAVEGSSWGGLLGAPLRVRALHAGRSVWGSLMQAAPPASLVCVPGLCISQERPAVFLEIEL